MQRPRETNRRAFPRPRATGRARLGLLAEIALVLCGASLLVLWRLRSTAEDGGLVRIADDEVAVVTDLWTGEQRSVLTPGFELVLPRLETVHELDKSPVQYVMAGAKRLGPNDAPRLVVRARDGSVYWFEHASIQYGLDVRRLEVVLQDSGPGNGFRERLMDAFARATLHAELGRHGAKEVVSPEVLQAAGVRARERLNAALEPHGIEVYEVTLSKPSFDGPYEDTIERREVAEQEIQSLEQQASLMRLAQPSLLEEIEGKKELELLQARAEWQRQRDELAAEGERLRAGRPKELEQLEEYKRIALAKERAAWSEELAQAREAAAELERDLARKLASMDREHELETAAKEGEWARERASLEREAEGMRAAHDARLEILRRAKELERETMLGELAELRDAARARALQVAFEAESYRVELSAAGRARRDELLVEATELESRARREHASFLARAEAFAAEGKAVVRAALVERLSSILFEIAPYTPPSVATAESARHVPATVAAKDTEGAR